MDFVTREYPKFGTKSTIIKKGGEIKLDNAVIEEKKRDKFGNYTARVKLDQRTLSKLNDKIEELNDFLTAAFGNEKVKNVVYGDAIYPKISVSIPIKEVKRLKLRSVYINSENSYLQMFLR